MAGGLGLIILGGVVKGHQGDGRNNQDFSNHPWDKAGVRDRYLGV